ALARCPRRGRSLLRDARAGRSARASLLAPPVVLRRRTADHRARARRAAADRLRPEGASDGARPLALRRNDDSRRRRSLRPLDAATAGKLAGSRRLVGGARAASLRRQAGAAESARGLG